LSFLIPPLSHFSFPNENRISGSFLTFFTAFDKDVSSHTDITKQLQFYFMCCSILINTEQGAIIASTLANGGVNPITAKRVFSAETSRDCLSLMFSCGMYDYSGQFSFHIGLPAKSGVSGIVMLVVPDAFGVAIWSPRLDSYGNSARGVEFCTRLTEKFPFHVFDCVVDDHKPTPIRQLSGKDSHTIDSYEMIFACAAGDLSKIIALVNRKVSVNCSDYDGRTPLHLAVAESRFVVVEFLLRQNANKNAKDRWGKTPVEEAKGKCEKVFALLEKS
jgi:glutaminase